MLKIRLKRAGRKKKPIYRIVLMKSLSKRDGKELFNFGYYDPIKKMAVWDRTHLLYYILVGAVPTDTVRHIVSYHIDLLSYGYSESELNLMLPK